MGVCSKCGLRTVSQDCECLQRQLRQAERQALLNLGQAWQREDITQAQLREASGRADIAEALVGRFALRCREIAVKDCGYWQAKYDDHEGVALLEEADRIITPAEAQARQKEGSDA